MLDELIKHISEKTGFNEDEIKRKIIQKKRELDNLISDEGAAYIVAKEFGIALKKQEEITKLKDANEGNITTIVRIVKSFPVHKFDTEKAKGRVKNFIVADETGEAKLSLWNEEIDEYDLKENEVIKIRGFVRIKDEKKEIRVGNYGIIEKLKQEYKRKHINELNVNEMAEIRAAIVHVFEFSPYFNICPNCGSGVKNNECKIHGKVKPKKALVVNTIIDDGYGNIRAVFFRENVEKIRAKESDDVIKDILKGKEFVLHGTCKLNKIFNRLEFIVDNVEEVNVEKEIECFYK